jgi:hypothetical protein
MQEALTKRKEDIKRAITMPETVNIWKNFQWIF